MLAQGKGSIINLASIGSFIAYPWASAYLASKGGVLGITRGLALEWRDRGVRVNGIGPTLMDSPLTKAAAATTSITADLIKARMLRPRLGLPRELIGAAIFPGQRRFRAGHRSHHHVRRRLPGRLVHASWGRHVRRRSHRPGPRGDHPASARGAHRVRHLDHAPPGVLPGARGARERPSGFAYGLTRDGPLAAIVHRTIAPQLSGQPFDDPERLFHKALWANNAVHAAGIGMRALCVVDCAVWDLAAKAKGQNITAFLGGERGGCPSRASWAIPPCISPRRR